MINEDGWIMMKDMKILVDVDTMFLLETNTSEFGWQKDKLLTCKVSSELKGSQLKKKWDDMYKHASRVRARMNRHFDGDKVSSLLEDLSISDSSQDLKDLNENDQEP